VIEVVIVTWNTRAACLRLLGQVATLAPDAGVTVVDNASSDGTAAAISAEYPDVRVLTAPHNLGYAGGINHALPSLTGELLLVINSDVELADPKVVPVLSGVLEDDPRCAAVGPAIVGPDGRFEVGAGGYDPTLASALLHFSGASSLSSRVHGLYLRQGLWAGRDEPVEVDWISGAAFLIRRSALIALGGMPDAAFLYAEDLRLGRRLREAGHRVLYAPHAAVVHHGGGSQGGRPSARWVDATLDAYADEEPRVAQRLMQSIFGAGLLARSALWRVRGRPERAAEMRRYARAAWRWS